MELRLFFLLNFPGAIFIQGSTFIPDSRVQTKTATIFSDSIRFQFRKNWEEQIFCQIGECATQKQKHPLLKYLN
jgi:hypothetical protein